MAKRKIDQDFILSDSTVNVYGFRLMTEGCVLEEVMKNPIGYYGHDYDDGVLLLWDEVRVVGDQILGKPVINMEHERAERTIQEIEDGFLNAASVGNICLLEHHLEPNPEDPEHPILVGTKWYYKECSLVDSPGNRNAFKLFDINDKELSLPDLLDRENFINNSKTSEMEGNQFKITPQLVTLLGLSDDADGKEFAKSIKNLHDRAVAGDAAVTENGTLKTELKNLKDAAVSKEVAALLAQGLADKKLTVALSNTLKGDYATNPTGLKNLLDAMTPYQSIVEKIQTGAGKDVTNLKDMDWDALDKADKLQDLKDNDPTAYAEKFKAKFGREPRA